MDYSSGRVSLWRSIKASSISEAMLSGWARNHVSIQPGSFSPNCIFFSSGLLAFFRSAHGMLI